ncbi:MAG: MFS transporter [Pirellulales bacterium]
MASRPSTEQSFAAADRNVGLFVAFRVLFNARFYYPVFLVMFLDFGITVAEFALLNAIWAAAIVLLEVPSAALADLIGRRRLLVAGAALMVVEMLLLVLVPVPSVWVLPALAANRVVSGAAEAFISGADEALAFESLAACGRAGEWPRVLEKLLRYGGIVTIIGMVTGSLVYDPGLLDSLAHGAGLAGGFTRADTFRLPIWLTLASALGAFAAAIAMREPPRALPSIGHAAATGLTAAFRQTAATGCWILTQPLVLLMIMAGVLIDLPIRQVLVVSSEIYAEIDIPTAAFGLVSAASALVGLAVAGPPRRRPAPESSARPTASGPSSDCCRGGSCSCALPSQAGVDDSASTRTPSFAPVASASRPPHLADRPALPRSTPRWIKDEGRLTDVHGARHRGRPRRRLLAAEVAGHRRRDARRSRNRTAGDH